MLFPIWHDTPCLRYQRLVACHCCALACLGSSNQTWRRKRRRRRRRRNEGKGKRVETEKMLCNKAPLLPQNVLKMVIVRQRIMHQIDLSKGGFGRWNCLQITFWSLFQQQQTLGKHLLMYRNVWIGWSKQLLFTENVPPRVQLCLVHKSKSVNEHPTIYFKVWMLHFSKQHLQERRMAKRNWRTHGGYYHTKCLISWLNRGKTACCLQMD